MKKHDEGYVLAMVMCVIAVLAVVASAMLGVGLRNVQTQQAAVVRMQEKYAAEGQLEILRAELREHEGQIVSGTLNAAAVQSEITKTLTTYTQTATPSGEWTCTETKSNELVTKVDFTSPIFTIETKSVEESGDTTITCDIVLTGTANVDGTSQFTITINNIDFQSYEATTETVPEDSTSSEPSEEVPEI